MKVGYFAILENVGGDVKRLRLRPDTIISLREKGKGEFSLRTYEAFERHLQKLHKSMKSIPDKIKEGKYGKGRLFHEIYKSAPMWF